MSLRKKNFQQKKIIQLQATDQRTPKSNHSKIFKHGGISDEVFLTHIRKTVQESTN
jgi:hypothetical protein